MSPSPASVSCASADFGRAPRWNCPNAWSMASSHRASLHFVSSSWPLSKSESLKAKPGEHLLGSSEVIESVLGRLKRLEQNQAKSGFTGLVLSVAAVVSKTTLEVVQQAMETVPTKTVREWIRGHLGQSVQAKRKIAFSNAEKSEQIWDQLFEEL